jgi:hypothetical protein
MGYRRLLSGGLALATTLAFLRPAFAQDPAGINKTAPPAPVLAAIPFAPTPVPLDAVNPAVRERVSKVLERPTLTTHGPVEAFTCRPSTYRWLLDHPDRTVSLWRMLGAKCTEIENWGGGRFGWRDDQGSVIHWETVLETGHQRLWYAEGQVKVGTLLPAIHVRAVVVLNYETGTDRNNRPAVRHQMDLLIRTDSRAISLATRLLGASAPHVAEQYVTQMEMFFGALAWYLDQHPQRAAHLLQRVQAMPASSPPATPGASVAPMMVPDGNGAVRSNWTTIPAVPGNP